MVFFLHQMCIMYVHRVVLSNPNTESAGALVLSRLGPHTGCIMGKGRSLSVGILSVFQLDKTTLRHRHWHPHPMLREPNPMTLRSMMLVVKCSRC